jgi:hypothetical protein
MAEPTEPLTPEEEAALRELEITHRRWSRSHERTAYTCARVPLLRQGVR